MDSYDRLSSRAIHILDNQYASLQNAIERKTQRALANMQKKEAGLQKALARKDSLKAQQVFTQYQIKYNQLQAQLQSPIDKSLNNPLREYIPGMDSMQTALRFLSQAGAKLPGIPLDKWQQVQALCQQIQQLQGSLQKANDVQRFLKDREQQLKDQLNNYGLGKQLMSINKQVYYFQQQLKEYKTALHDTKKLERKLLETVNTIPAFHQYMQKYSYLAQLFGLPDDYGSPESLLGLQTRAQLQQIISQRFGSASPGGAEAGTDPGQLVQQQLQAARLLNRS